MTRAELAVLIAGAIPSAIVISDDVKTLEVNYDAGEIKVSVVVKAQMGQPTQEAEAE